MSAVEDEIVSMKFDNRQFEQGVGQTLNSLEKLKSSLRFDGADRGLSNVQTATNRFNTNGMVNQVDRVKHSFSAMAIVAATVISTVTRQVFLAGERIAKQLTIQPLLDGFREYETNINSIQTILANTKSAGTSLDDVNSALQQLNHYSDKTIYNFSQMAKNIGTFTAAGVGLDDSVNAIKGIANLAALSGSTSEQASTAMYQLSQAISAGRVSLQDWNSVVNAGMGGTVFQRALAQTAAAMGTLDKSAVKLKGPMKNVTIAGQSFRESITARPGEKSWLTSKVLTNTLAQFTGDLSEAELKAQGFNDQQIKAIQATARTAQNAATQVKTISQLFSTLQESAGSGWSKTFQIVFGDFQEAKGLFTGASKTFGSIIQNSAKARNKVLQDWKDLGGRDVLIKGLNQAFTDLQDLVRPIGKAFHDVFPAQTGKTLLELTKNFKALMEEMKPSKNTIENLRRTFRGLFAAVDIVWQVIKGVARGFGALFDAIGGGQGSFLEFTGGIGDVITKFDEFLKKGDFIGKFFENLGSIVAVPIKLLLGLAGAIAGLFDGFDTSKLDDVTESFGRIDERLSPLQQLFVGALNVFRAVLGALGPVTDAIGKALQGLGDAIAQSMGNGNFNAVFDVINASLLTGIALLIRNFFKNGFKFDLTGGLVDKIKGVFGQLGDTLSAMEAQIKAKALMNIAAAIGILTASVLVLSLIDSKKLTKALSAMAVGFGELFGSLVLLMKLDPSGVKMLAISGALVLLASAMLVLSTAVAVLGNLKWETIGKGLVAISGALVAIALGMKLMPSGPNMLLQAAALNLVATAIAGIGLAIAGLGQLSWAAIAKGLVTIAGALAIIAGAIALMPPTMIAQAAGLAIVSKAIVLIGLAVAGLGQMGWENIAKGLVALGGALAIIAGGLALMSGTLAGSAALLVAAGALAVIAPVLVTLGGMSWESIAKGLVAIAGAFAVVGVAGLLLAPILPGLIGLGVALTLIGTGMALAGAGALAFATAFSIFTAAGSAGIAVIGAMISLIPDFMSAFAEGIIQFAKTLVDNVDELQQAFVELVSHMLDGAIKLIPKVGKLFTKLIQTGIKVLRKNGPDMINVGFFLIDKFLGALDRKIPGITDKATDIVVKFLNQLGKELPRIVDAGFKMVIKFINGVAKAIDRNSEEVGRAGARLGLALVRGAAKAIAGAAHEVIDQAKSMAQQALDAVKKPWKIFSPSKATREFGMYFAKGAALGIGDHAHEVSDNTEKMANNALDTMRAVFNNAKNLGLDSEHLAPRVTPVLDLTQLQKDATKIGSSFGRHNISARVSAQQASDISAQHYAAARRLADESMKPSEVKFEQNNYSPKALDPVTIYRNGKSQFALAKEALGL